MIEKVAAVSFTGSGSGIQLFSVDLGAEGSFKLIRAMTFFGVDTDFSITWGFSAAPDGGMTTVGVNAPNYSNTIENNVLIKVVDENSMVGTNHRYMLFSLSLDSSDQVGIYIAYYSFEGFTNPNVSIQSGTIAPNSFEVINYATSPQLQVVKSIWLSAPLEVSPPVFGNVFIAQVPAVGSGAYIGSVNLQGSCASAVYGLWLPNNNLSLQISNDSASPAGLTYYVTSIGR